MSARPSSENQSTQVRTHSVHVANDSTCNATTHGIGGTTSSSEKGVVRRVDGLSGGEFGRQMPKSGHLKPAAKPRRKVVSESVIIDWLGGDDFEDHPVVAKPAKSVSIATRSKVAANDAVPHPLPPSDDAILARVAERLVERKIASFARIGLDIKCGVITVRGTVASKGERLLLIHVLQTTPGVQRVNDGLIVGKANAPSTRESRSLTSLPSLPAIPSLPALPSFATLKEGLSSIKPLQVGVTFAALTLFAFFFVPRGVARSVAVYPVKGRVVLGGKPLADANVILHPIGASKLPQGLLPRGVADSEGGLVFQTFEPADGAPEGEFVATVQLRRPVLFEGDMVPGPDVLPGLYRSPETSPFRVKITREIKEISLLELHETGGMPTSRN